MTTAVFLAATVAVTALLCGHQGQPWPIPLRATLRGLWRPRRASPVPDCPEPSIKPHTATQARPPSWAHTQPNNHGDTT